MPDVDYQIRALQGGQINSCGSFNLATGVTTTTVTRRGVSSTSLIFVTSSDADADMSVDIKRIIPGTNEFEVQHSNSANVRTYKYLFITPPA